MHWETDARSTDRLAVVRRKLLRVIGTLLPQLENEESEPSKPGHDSREEIRTNDGAATNK
jgi:hypothetical protein